MALIVEDGTGKADAESFASVATCTAYCASKGLTDWDASASDALKEAALRRATAFLDHSFSWIGQKTKGRSQALSWPREGVVDSDGWSIASNEVPKEIMSACCEIAARELASPGSTNPDVVMTDRVKREKVGSLEVEFAAAPISPEASRPVLLSVQALISGLVLGTASSIAGSVVRS